MLSSKENVLEFWVRPGGMAGGLDCGQVLQTAQDTA